MTDKKYILFDLDGSLTDPFEGITKSFLYALDFYGIKEKQENLKKIIGPPLKNSFMEYYGFNEVDADKAVAKYRERFSTKGIFENYLYDGIDDMLKALKANGNVIILATSKPIEFAEQILEHFGIKQYFDFFAGSNLKGERGTKTEVIRYALEIAGVKDLSQAVMVGDRHHDIDGAKEVGIESVGVLFGYGGREELKKAGADVIAETVSELEKILINK